MFIDDAAEVRLLGSTIDHPHMILRYTDDLFTGDRVNIFRAMKDAYLTYGDISSEGVELFYGHQLPPNLEMARGAKPTPIIETLGRMATKRQLASLTDKLTVLISQNNLDRDEINKLLSLTPIFTNEDSSLIPGVVGFVSELQRKRSGQYRFIRTGLPFLDHMLGGEWPRQALTVVIGQAGGGKTALVCQSILSMARAGIPTFFASLEMPKARLVLRFAAHIAGIDGIRLRQGNITDEEQEYVNLALEEIQSLPIHIADSPTMTIDDIVYQAKLHKEAHGIEAMFVDYIQIINRPNAKENENGADALGDLAQRLRNAAVQLDIAAVVLSQQNRSAKGLNSILGSGRISHIADSVFEILIEPTSTNDDKRSCQLEFHKNRDGPVGMTTAFYKPRYLRFE